MKPAHALYDILLVGGGLVGATLACALAPSGVRIALAEARAPALDWSPAQFDIRVSAITHGSQRIFETLGVWDGIARRRISPFRQMHVWDSSGNGKIHFDSAALGEGTLGHIIENGVMVAALYERLAQLDNVELVCPVRLKRLVEGTEDMVLECEDGRILASRLLIGADGSRSWVRQQAGIDTTGRDYRQCALVTTIKTARPHQETAWQRFLPEGPLAFLPLTEGYSSLVWSTTPAQAESLLALPLARFADTLRVAFDDTLGEIVEVGARASFPLRFLQTKAYVRPRLALVGDAAHTVHPLAGQGVNLGLADAAALAEVLSEAIVARKDLGSIAVLRRYERWRHADNLAMLAAMDGFQRLFSSELSVVRWVRNLGLNLTHSMPPIKNSLMRYAMGMGGDLPKLARGVSLWKRH